MDGSALVQEVLAVMINGEEWTLPSWAQTPEDLRVAHCKACFAPMLWVLTTKGNRAPLNPDGTSHFASCPEAERFRRKRV